MKNVPLEKGEKAWSAFHISGKMFNSMSYFLLNEPVHIYHNVVFAEHWFSCVRTLRYFVHSLLSASHAVICQTCTWGKKRKGKCHCGVRCIHLFFVSK